MAKVNVNERFIESYMNNKALEAVKILNEIKDALDTKEQALIGKINGIIEEIISIEF